MCNSMYRSSNGSMREAWRREESLCLPRELGTFKHVADCRQAEALPPSPPTELWGRYSM